MGSLGGCSVQWVCSSAHQCGDGAADGGHRVFGCHVFYGEKEEEKMFILGHDSDFVLVLIKMHRNFTVVTF